MLNLFRGFLENGLPHAPELVHVMVVVMDVKCSERHLRSYIQNTLLAALQAPRAAAGMLKFTFRMIETYSEEQNLKQFGKRAQRCYGCFVAYHLKDMYLGEDATFFCEHCKDDTMFHFDDFSKLMDLSKLNGDGEDHHDH